MIGHRNEIARLQSDMYRNRYHKLLRSLILLSIVMLILVATIIYLLFTSMVPPFYGSTTTGRIVQMMPVSVTKGKS